MNILDVLMQAQGGNAASQLGQQFGLNGTQTRSALEALLPSLSGALAQNAQAPGGLDALLGALQGGGHSRYVDNPQSLGEPGTVEDGNNILGHLFGSKEVSRSVASQAAAQTGIGAELLKKMLPLVAAMVMGGLAKRSAGGAAGAGLNPGGFGGLGQAGAPAQAGGGGLLDMLTPMLDRNKDGSAMDDILGMAASFLTRR